MDKPVILRVQAEQDVDDALAYYLNEVAGQAALGFIDALEHAYTRISRHSGAGSPRYSHELQLPGLRNWPLRRYPYQVFYIEHPGHIDIWRILHSARDIPAWLHETNA